MAEVPLHKTWVANLLSDDLDANLYAVQMLSFAVMVGQNLDSKLMVYLVPLLNQNEFSVDWLASQRMKSICGMMGPLGQRPNFAKMLCYLAIAICDHHAWAVLDKEEDLKQLLGVDYWAIQVVLRHAFDRNPVSYYTGFPVFMSKFFGDKGYHCW